MPRRMRIVTVLAVALPFIACVGTHMTSELNPQVTPTRFSTLVAVAPFRSLQYEQQAEKDICLKVQRESATTCLPYSTVLMPGQSHSSDEELSILRAHHVDGFVMLVATNSGASHSAVPWVVPGQESGSASATCYGNTCNGYYSGSYSPGYVMSIPVNKPYASWRIGLFRMPKAGEEDAPASKRMVWVATATTSGNGFTNVGDLVRAIANKTASELKKAGLLARPCSTWYTPPNGKRQCVAYK